MNCVLCGNTVMTDLLLTGDGYVCWVHVSDPNRIDAMPPIVIRRYDPELDGRCDVRLQGMTLPPKPPEPRVSVDLCLSEAQLVKQALLLAGCREPNNEMAYQRIVVRINALVREEVGIVSL